MKQFLLLACLLLLPLQVFADDAPDKSVSSAISWTSVNTDDVITIQNGNGIPLTIIITVSGKGSPIKVKNCGTTGVVQPGSTAICTSTDASTPVSFADDNNDKPANGTYQIKQQ